MSSKDLPRLSAKVAEDGDPEETREWLESMQGVLEHAGPDRAVFMIRKLTELVQRSGISMPFTANTPYINTIADDDEPAYPGNLDIERHIRSFVRWNAMAMVISGNRNSDGIGGHISTFASAATLYEVAFNHFLRGRTDKQLGDVVYFQGHASPGIYARAFLEGRISEKLLDNFRRELAEGGGLPSYPHPRLMPGFWQFPTVSMGLGPIMSIFQARFNRYLQHRGLVDTSNSRVWCFVGDGETDEPESLGSINMAVREKLDNLVWVVNCNLQRLDGPVRGNSSIIQELEAVFRGAGWNVIKVVWGSDWDPLFEKDKDNLLIKAFNMTVDGEFQRYSVSDGAYIRKHFFGKIPELEKMVENYSDHQLARLNRGGHDVRKVYAAYAKAVVPNGRPTVILAKTIKGYGLGESGEGRNVAHQQKKLNEKELLTFRTRFGIPVPESQVAKTPFYKPADDSKEMAYLRKRREVLGGNLPARYETAPPLPVPDDAFFAKFTEGSQGREASTTMGYVTLLTALMARKDFGRHIVPIVPDEARTFGMESMFRQFGIYSSEGQLYEPVDKESLMAYREAKNGQILEEGLNEAGAMSSFIAAGTSYATHGVNMVPFYIYYSMFGFQRVGDLIWAAMDVQARGFLIGAVAGRTTLNGEGLQHEDGHSPVLASTVPKLLTYDPAYVYELAVILKSGLRRMFVKQDNVFYYLTVYNEAYEQPAMPAGVEEGIVRGIYKLRRSSFTSPHKVQILSSGVLVREALRGAQILEERFGIAADVWSVTSFNLLRMEALEVEHWNRLHPADPPRLSYIEEVMKGEQGAFIATTDYMKIVPEQLSPWIPGGLSALGTDGYGHSSSREELRRYFEVDGEFVAIAALQRLAKLGELPATRVQDALRELGINPDKSNPYPLV